MTPEFNGIVKNLPSKEILVLKRTKIKSMISISMLVTANLLTAFSAQAEIDYITCNSCSDSRMKLSAEATKENKIVNVVDFSNFTTKSYLVFNEPGHSSAREVSAHPALETAMSEFDSFQAYLDATLRNNDIKAVDLKSYLINTDSANDFIKVIRFKSRQNDLAQALGQYLGSGVNLEIAKNLVAVFGAAAVSKFATPLNYEVRIKFGSDYLKFKYDGLTLLNGNIQVTFKPVEGSGRIGDIMLRSLGSHGFELYGAGIDVITALEGMGFSINYASSSRTQVSTGSASIGCSGSKAKPCFVID